MARRPETKRVAVINPMKSCRPTGIGVAGDAIPALLSDDVAVTSPRLDRWFTWINDAALPAVVRMLFRIGLAQFAPWFFPREGALMFTSHHAPLWRTGRHAIIVYDLIALHLSKQARIQHVFFKRVLPRISRCAGRIVTISETVRVEMRAVFPALGEERFVVIPAFSKALDKAVDGGAYLEMRRAAGYFLVVGARYPHKNLGLVLDAIELMAPALESPFPLLVVAGCSRSLWPTLARLEEAGRVRVIERPDDAEIAALYKTALALAYPSLIEGQGLPPLEAMAHGCPVICSDIPVLRETCGGAAFYVDPHDAFGLARLFGELLSGERAADLAQHRAVAITTIARFSQAELRVRWAAFIEAFA